MNRLVNEAEIESHNMSSNVQDALVQAKIQDEFNTVRVPGSKLKTNNSSSISGQRSKK